VGAVADHPEKPGEGPSPPLRLSRLLPAGEPASVSEIVEGLGLWQRPGRGGTPDRPRTLLNMISTADGLAALAGRSGPISGPADREMFHGLRLAVDGVLVGAGTARAERYGRLIGDRSRRELRLRRGLTEEPLACIVSSHLAIDPGLPLLAEPAARVAILTPSEGELAPCAASVQYVRARREDGGLDLTRALRELAERFDVRSLLCEGGPHLADELLAAGLLDELFLSLAAKLAGGDEGGGGLRILAGPVLDPVVELELLGVLEHDSHLFLRYGVAAPVRVSRETTPSSSLAR